MHVFRYVQVFLTLKVYLDIDKTQMLKKIPSDKINSWMIVTPIRNSFFFLSQGSNDHSFTFMFNLQFLYWAEAQCLSVYNIVCGIFHFQYYFVFIAGYIFVQ